MDYSTISPMTPPLLNKQKKTTHQQLLWNVSFRVSHGGQKVWRKDFCLVTIFNYTALNNIFHIFLEILVLLDKALAAISCSWYACTLIFNRCKVTSLRNLRIWLYIFHALVPAKTFEFFFFLLWMEITRTKHHFPYEKYALRW